MTDLTPLEGNEAGPVEPATPPEAKGHLWLLPTLTGIGGFVLGLLVIGGGIAVTSGVAAANHDAAVQKTERALKSTFSKALKSCNLTDDQDSKIADSGYTLTLNNQGNDDLSGISFDNLDCIENALKTPESVKSHIGQTTSLDGRQSETWGRITMAWSYHPDRGLDAVYTLKH